MLSVAVLASFVCLVFGWQETFNGVNVQVGETSGTIKVSNENNSITIAFKELVEMSQNGIEEVGLRSKYQHNFRNFDYAKFYPDGPAHYVDVLSEEGVFKSNISVYKQNFTAELTGKGVTFNLEIWVFENDTIIKNWRSDETYKVHNGTVKFAFTIDNWLFCGFNDTHCVNKDGTDVEYGRYLDVYLNYVAARKDEAPVRGRQRGRNEYDHRKHPMTFDYGGADVTSSRMYMENYTWYDLPYGYPKNVRKKDHNYITKNYEVIRLPNFYSTVYYNAFVNISTLEYISGSSCHNSVWLPTIVSSLLVFLVTWYLH